MAFKTYQYRIYPTPKQVTLLQNILDVTRHWYNMCLEERTIFYQQKLILTALANGESIEAAAAKLKGVELSPLVRKRIKALPEDQREHAYNYERLRISVQIVKTVMQVFNVIDLQADSAAALLANSFSASKFEQYRRIPHYRKTFLAASNVPVTILRAAADDIDQTFTKFFAAMKKGTRHGYPRYRKFDYHNSFATAQFGSGMTIKNNRLHVTGAGLIKVKFHRPYFGAIKTAEVIRKIDEWYVSLVCEVSDPVPLPQTNRAVGIDVGIHHLMVLSDGTIIDNPRWYRESQARLRVLQRKLARCQPGSNNTAKVKKQVQKLHLHTARQRKDFLDKLVYKLTLEYDYIYLEDLKITNMVKNEHLSKSILDAGWGYFKEKLKSKSGDTGSTVVLIAPHYTSQLCSNCGANLNIGLSDRWVTCDCGMSLDRDHNAALNILKKGRDTSLSA